MIRLTSNQKFIKLTVVFVAAMLSMSCLPNVPRSTGTSIDKHKITSITPGKTTKWDLMKWFGYPTSIVGANSPVAEIRSPSYIRSKAETSGSSRISPSGGYYRVQPLTFLECLDRKKLNTNERLYYFAHTWTMQYSLFFLLGTYDFGGTTSKELLVIVDEETEKVVSYFYLGE